mmetsp:Transcript_31073/g.68990  ORF Transcript_31073/g.68990 Transcript_31073/m.68990 type:complete len:341 (+) Transcript_31073:71-1093(+)
MISARGAPLAGCSRYERCLAPALGQRKRVAQRLLTTAHAAAQSASSKVPPAELLAAAKAAALVGAEVVMDAVNKPRNISRKEGTDIVTETDNAAEAAITAALLQVFPNHAVLGEESGLMGDPTSDYLWCIDPLDGTVNFAHGYSGFNVSVGVLRHATPIAGCVVEFIGAPGQWSMRVFTGSRNGGAFCNGEPIMVSRTKKVRDALVATELVMYEDMWPHLQQLHTVFTRDSRGVRMSGAAAANLCHLAQGTIDTYWQFNLKPWDAAAGVIIAEEAGARISTADGTAFSVFDKSLLATNDALYEQMLAITDPVMDAMHEQKVDLTPYKIEGYRVKTGAQLE